MTTAAKRRPPLAGDETELYLLHAEHLIASVRRAVFADHAHIEDACQFAWAQLLAHQPRRETVFAWLRTVAIREVWRTSKIERRDVHDLEFAVATAAEDALDEQVAARDALRVLSSLRPNERRYLTLQVAGLSRDEIVAHCGVTHTHVNRHLTRGRRRARLQRG